MRLRNGNTHYPISFHFEVDAVLHLPAPFSIQTKINCGECGLNPFIPLHSEPMSKLSQTFAKSNVFPIQCSETSERIIAGIEHSSVIAPTNHLSREGALFKMWMASPMRTHSHLKRILTACDDATCGGGVTTAAAAA